MMIDQTNPILLDQSSGTPSLNPSDQSTTYTHSNAFWRRTFF